MASSTTPEVWFITGCSSGFGAALTLEVLARGGKVIASARDVTKLNDLENVGADIIQLDVTAPLTELKKTAEEAYKIYGRLDYLINNAGYASKGTFEETDPEDVQAQFNTNVFGLINVTRAFLPYLRAQRSGVIGNITSVATWATAPSMGIYCSSKAAASVVSETMVGELAELGIKVCTIEPGAYRSNLLGQGRQNPSGKHDERQQGRISDYDGTASRKVQAMLDQLSNTQPGDVNKAAKVLADVLTNKLGRGVPPRLVLGSDAHASVREQCGKVLKSLDEWQDVTTVTDVDA